MGKWSEKISEDAQGEAVLKPSKPGFGGFDGSRPYDSSEIQDLPPGAKSRLRVVVDRLTVDCVRWYCADADILEQLPDDALEFAVLEFLSKREWYLRQEGTAQ